MLSTWDELFISAIQKKKDLLLEKKKGNDILKGLAKSVNEEMQGKVEEQRIISQVTHNLYFHAKFSQLLLIYNKNKL